MTLNGISQSGTQTYIVDTALASGGYYSFDELGAAKNGASITLGYDAGKKINALNLTPAEGAALSWSRAAGTIDNAAKLDDTRLSVEVSQLSSSEVQKTAYIARNANWNYQTFGYWNAPSTPPAQGSYGVLSVGEATAGDKIPTTGSATYTGEVIGAYSTLLVVATLSARVDFGSRTVQFETTNSRQQALTQLRWFDLGSIALTSSNIKYDAQTNQITGSVSNSVSNDGSINARFYGPNAEQIGGTFKIGSGGSTYFAAFGGKK